MRETVIEPLPFCVWTLVNWLIFLPDLSKLQWMSLLDSSCRNAFANFSCLLIGERRCRMVWWTRTSILARKTRQKVEGNMHNGDHYCYQWVKKCRTVASDWLSKVQLHIAWNIHKPILARKIRCLTKHYSGLRISLLV